MATIRDRSDRSWSGAQDFLGNVRIRGTLTADGIPSMDGLSLVINSNAAAGTNEDPGLKLKGGDGGSEIIQTTVEQDSSADTTHLFMGGGAAGTTRKSPTFSIGHSAETGAGIDATLKLTGSTDAGVTKVASVVLLGEEQRLTVTSPADLRLSDSTATLQLAAGALTATSLASVNLSPSGAAQLGATNSSGTTTIASGTSVSIAVPDNTANALRVLEGANEYLKVTTTNSSEAIVLGNATTNPAYSFLGTGTTTLNGPLAMSGQKVTGLAAATGNGEAVRYEQAVLKTDYSASGIVLVGSGSGTYSGVGAVNASAGAGDAGKLVRLDASGLVASSMMPAKSALFYVGGGARAATTNTNVMIYPTLDSSRSTGSGITRVNSATLGTYFEVTQAGFYAVSATHCPSGGAVDVAIKAAAAVNNSFTGADTDIVAAAYGAAANHPVNLSATVYVAANTRFWVVATRDGDGQAYHNMLSVCGPF